MLAFYYIYIQTERKEGCSFGFSSVVHIYASGRKVILDLQETYIFQKTVIYLFLIYIFKCSFYDDDDDDDVSLTSLFHACTGRTVAPLQLPDSQSF